MGENEKFMRLAFEQTSRAVEAGNEPFRAVLFFRYARLYSFE